MIKKAKKIKISHKVQYFVNTGIFPATVCFNCGFTYDEIIALFKKKKADQWAKGLENDKQLIDNGTNFALARHMTNTKTGKQVSFYYIILIERFKFTDYDMCVLAHEILHICQFLLKQILDREKEIECEAYLHTYLMENILNILRKP
jgi:hypothetical protein